MSTHTQASRRRDVFTTQRLGSYIPKRKSEAQSAAVRLRGVDSAGRFVGPRDLDRGFEYFWSSRRGAAPIVRASFDFGARVENRGGRGKPRSTNRSGLDFEKLRTLHRRWDGGQGENAADLAREAGVCYQTLRYHLSGSPSMRAALAAAPAEAA